MKDEIVKEGMGNLKKTIIGIITTAVTAAGAYVTTHINEVFGIEEESDTPTEMVAPVENNNSNSNSNSNSNENTNTQNQSVIINIPAQQPVQPTRTIIKETVREVPAEPVQPVEEKPETNAERMARLKKLREEKNK